VAPTNEVPPDPEPVAIAEPAAEPEAEIPPSNTSSCGPTTTTPIRADIVAFDDSHSQSKAMHLYFNAGAQDGVTIGWGGILVDTAGNQVAGTGFCIDLVKQTSSQADVTVSRSVVQANLQVLLYPP
jgi:hypothetical protein